MRLIELASGILFWVWQSKDNDKSEKLASYIYFVVILWTIGWILKDLGININFDEARGFLNENLPEGIASALIAVFNVIGVLIGLALIPVAFAMGITSLFLLATVTVLSFPILIVSYAISGMLTDILPEKPTLPLIFGGWTTLIYHCAGDTFKAGIHEFLTHVMRKIFPALKA